MVSLETFSELLEVLYSAPLDQEQWPRFLMGLVHHTQSTAAIFFCGDGRLGPSIHAIGGSLPALLNVRDSYNERHAPQDPYRLPLIRQGRVRVLQAGELFPDDDLLRSEFYLNFLVHIGLRFGTMVPLALSVRRFETISIWRGPEQGPMPEDSVHLLGLLIPHIQKALEIRQVLGVAQQRLAGAEAMVDASATATFLLSRQGRVAHSNAAADALLKGAGALISDNGRLLAAQPRSRKLLSDFFLAVTLPVGVESGATPVRALCLERGPGRQPLQLLASPLPPQRRSGSNADLLLLVSDPEKPCHFSDSILRALYGFTVAETEVANGLLTGYSLQEIAILRRVSVGTVRQQLKSMLTRTGTSRQSDLVRLLMTLPQAPTRN